MQQSRSFQPQDENASPHRQQVLRSVPKGSPLSPAKSKMNQSPLQSRLTSPRKYTIRRIMRGPTLADLQSVEQDIVTEAEETQGPITPIAIEKSTYGLLRIKPRPETRKLAAKSIAIQAEPSDIAGVDEQAGSSEPSESSSSSSSDDGAYSEDRLEHARQLRGLRMALHRAKCEADKARQSFEQGQVELNEKISELENQSAELLDALQTATTSEGETQDSLAETQQLMKSQREKLLRRISLLVHTTQKAHETVQSQSQELQQAREELKAMGSERSKFIVGLASVAALVAVWTGFVYSHSC